VLALLGNGVKKSLTKSTSATSNSDDNHCMSDGGNSYSRCFPEPTKGRAFGTYGPVPLCATTKLLVLIWALPADPDPCYLAKALPHRCFQWSSPVLQWLWSVYILFTVRSLTNGSQVSANSTNVKRSTCPRPHATFRVAA
jgi:hypothetical protein